MIVVNCNLVEGYGYSLFKGVCSRARARARGLPLPRESRILPHDLEKPRAEALQGHCPHARHAEEGLLGRGEVAGHGLEGPVVEDTKGRNGQLVRDLSPELAQLLEQLLVE